MLEGFFDAIQCSLSYILTNTDKEQSNPPLLECKLELQSPDMVFNPSLEQVLGVCGCMWVNLVRGFKIFF